MPALSGIPHEMCGVQARRFLDLNNQNLPTRVNAYAESGEYLKQVQKPLTFQFEGKALLDLDNLGKHFGEVSRKLGGELGTGNNTVWVGFSSLGGFDGSPSSYVKGEV